MEIRVSGHNVEIGDAFKMHATSRLQAIADKYFSRALSSQVTLGNGAHGHGFHVDCAMHVRRGVILKAEASAADAHAALDGAAERIDKQLRRYKRKLKNHHAEPKSELTVNDASAYVVQAHPEHEEVPEENHPVIIAESAATIPTVSVSDAVMLMDLAHAPALLFRNSRSGQLGMVYHRADGHIGWIESNAA
jgi:ribosomal subunit interface protein